MDSSINAPYKDGTAERGSCLLLRCASQSSLDESSQRVLGGAGSCLGTGVAAAQRHHHHNHATSALDALNQMRKQGVLCDVFLVAGGIEVPAHRALLAACSPYFRAMFTQFEESRRDRVTLQGVDPLALQLLVDYVYNPEVIVTEDNVQVLLPAANLLQLTAVREACCSFLLAQLHPSNCLGIRAFADLHACVDLTQAADTYIQQHFSEVVECEEFLGLSHQQVSRLISSDHLTVSSEEKVLESVLNWAAHSPVKRQPHLSGLMEHVRLPLLSQECLAERMPREPALRGDIRCKDLLIEALAYHLMRPEQRQTVATPRCRPRKPVGAPKILLVVGGQAPKAIRSVECYDLQEERWYHAAEMISRRCRAGLGVVDGRIYAVGGFNGSLRVRTVDVYDAATDTWQPAPSMEARRSTLGVAVIDSCIYAVGGFDGATGLSSAEMLDTRAGIWKPLRPMSTRRSSVGVAVLQGKIYAVGGYDGASRQCLNSVECYDPETDTWSPVPDMSVRRSGAGVGVLDGLLYAVGGHDGPVVRRSVEVWRPGATAWRPAPDMAAARRNAGVLPHNGQLMVIGGDDGTSNLNTVEIYNPRTETWHTLEKGMSTGRSYAGVAIIDRPTPA